MAQVVHTQLHLEAVGGELPRQGHQAGVVDQQIQPAVAIGKFRSGTTHASQAGQIKLQQLNGTTPASGRCL